MRSRELELADARGRRAHVQQRIAMREELCRAEEVRTLLCRAAMRGSQLLYCERHGVSGVRPIYRIFSAQ